MSAVERASVYLFLDIDGVLSHHISDEDRASIDRRVFGGREVTLLERKKEHAKLFNTGALQNFRHLIERVEAVAQLHIVLSSAWRCGNTVEELKEVFEGSGFAGHLLDKTAEGEGWRTGENRDTQIEEWLEARWKSFPVHSVIILDDVDCNFSTKCPEAFVQVDPDLLLTQGKVEEAFKKVTEQLSCSTS